MLREVSSRITRLNSITNAVKNSWKKQSVRLISTKSQFKYLDDCAFPPENGFEQNSLYGRTLKIPHTTLDQYVWENFGQWANKTAVVCGATGRNYTYGKLRDHCAALAIRLQQKCKLGFGDTLAVCLPNVPEFPAITLGAIEAGLIVTTINPIYTAEEISKQLIDSDTKILFGTASNYPVLKEATNLAQRKIPIVCVRTSSDDALPDGAIDFIELSNPSGVHFSNLQHHNRDPEDVVFLPYSSGTTGLPKGVELTHTNIVANSEMLQVKAGQSALLLPTTDTFQDVLPCVLPFFHIYGLTVTMVSKLLLGTKLVTLPSFRPDTFIDALTTHKGTVLHVVPPIVIFMSNHDMVKPQHLKSIRNIFSGAAPMGALDAERLIAKAPDVVFAQGYGLTETSPVVLIGPLGSNNHSSVGSPPPRTQAKIVALNDPTNTALGPNETGELLVRGPQVMKGYHNNKQATDDIFAEGGWLRTGDIAHYDDNFQFYITDRLKELIKVKGFQVAPAELEEILRDHPEVEDAAVVGQAHPISGEVPRAFIVRRKNSIVSENDLKQYVAEKVAVYKKLEGGVTFLETIPKNASGKILRRQLREKYCS
ncbi:uncharacterized protein LOC131683420 [Topomyia yanbarensis]|uniref:uncharacterized protein LOC131683420 n=1 Tax=Topomyia yanbarensis TaxID=2498891 RepID=UPI00273C10E2|nr:uncharacterized protein LOC131683420 [Topomyia yanbarensis]XP_058821377.1 uncharacterized protein LOC131683420 [Topomyia yanbarensis]XP_058821378.1 uncharacterized protein LOC131683420 [Topomyia yanbarensis]XP_058821379.1 uncharacterized protein LOC131683420 [Topomyia yanbarensis]